MSQDRVDSSSAESLPTTDERINKSSITTRLCEMIRWNLPNFGNHLRRLMGLGGVPDVDREQESGNDINEMGSHTEYSNEDFSMWESSSSESNPFAVSIRPGNLAEFFGANYPSTSDAAPMDERSSADLRVSTILSPLDYSTRLMVSSGVNTSTNGIRRLTLADVINEDGVIIAQNPGDFAAALHARMGNQSTDGFETLFEPRHVPLFIPSHENNDYTMSTTTIDSSSSYGNSDTSDDEDEGVSELEILRRRREFYDNVTKGHTVRKQFRNLDDEPPIY
ncbi:uncharacterized protein LOC107042553 [Diachasma alloeum]|uniref:uncharacterized protein LOC107042553 n=1 Tax=Diachasma alloeum TaxID=454923 RepID=UPI0007381AA1|nr:uncharacterized protein LOC107042553 [Diachasma alloeum]